MAIFHAEVLFHVYFSRVFLAKDNLAFVNKHVGVPKTCVVYLIDVYLVQLIKWF